MDISSRSLHLILMKNSLFGVWEEEQLNRALPLPLAFTTFLGEEDLVFVVRTAAKVARSKNQAGWPCCRGLCRATFPSKISSVLLQQQVNSTLRKGSYLLPLFTALWTARKSNQKLQLPWNALYLGAGKKRPTTPSAAKVGIAIARGSIVTSLPLKVTPLSSLSVHEAALIRIWVSACSIKILPLLMELLCTKRP